jgi:hypothetical protein
MGLKKRCSVLKRIAKSQKLLAKDLNLEPSGSRFKS